MAAEQTMWFAEVRGAIIVCHNEQAPSQPEWDAYHELVASRLELIVGGIVVVHPEHPGPNALQRKLGSEVWGRRPDAGVAVITSSKLHRAIITGFGFFVGKQMQAFAPSAWRTAFRHAGAPPETWSVVSREIGRGLKAMGAVEACKSIGVDPAAWAHAPVTSDQDRV